MIGAATIVVGAVIIIGLRRGGNPSAAGDRTSADPVEVERDRTYPIGNAAPSPPAAAFASLRDCVQGKRCGPDSVCWPTVGGAACVTSDCNLEKGCPSGQTCRVASLSPRVLRCVAGGTVAEGEACTDVLPAPDAMNCSGGLSCWHGRCRKRCSKGDECGDGSRCVARSPAENVCATDVCLTDKDCPSSRPACVEFRDGSPSTCVRLAEGSCAPGRCTTGEACDASLNGDLLSGRCRRSCDRGSGATCAKDELCGPPVGTLVDSIALASGVCYRRCSFSNPGACSSGEVCSTLGGDVSRTACVATPMRGALTAAP